jgi:hypothetical protein
VVKAQHEQDGTHKVYPEAGQDSLVAKGHRTKIQEGSGNDYHQADE